MADYMELRRKMLEENKRKLEQLNLPHLSATLRPSPVKRVKKTAPKEETESVSLRRSGRIASLPERSYKPKVKSKNLSSASMDYLELRRKRIEENKRKLEQLNLAHLSATLRPPPVKWVVRTIPKEETEPDSLRRSGRIASLPEISYKPKVEHKKLPGRVYASDEVRNYAIRKAAKLQLSLKAKFPSFIQTVGHIHSLYVFTEFGNNHLPEQDTTITLVDEDGKKSDTTYLAKRRRLSTGWTGFAASHELVDGDALVLQLIKPTVFKVYIIKASDYSDDS